MTHIVADVKAEPAGMDGAVLSFVSPVATSAVLQEGFLSCQNGNGTVVTLLKGMDIAAGHHSCRTEPCHL